MRQRYGDTAYTEPVAHAPERMEVMLIVRVEMRLAAIKDVVIVEAWLFCVKLPTVSSCVVSAAPTV